MLSTAIPYINSRSSVCLFDNSGRYYSSNKIRYEEAL